MPQISATTRLHVTADEVWSVIGPFEAAVDWVPGAASCETEGEGVGAIRRVTTGDGARIVERLEQVDPAGRSYQYSIVEAPMPLDSYLSTLRVRALEEGCEVQWSCDFSVPAELERQISEALDGLYSAAMQGLSERFSS